MNTLGKRSFSDAFPSDPTFNNVTANTVFATLWVKTKRIYGDPNLIITTPADGTGGVTIEGNDADGNSLKLIYNLTADGVKCNSVTASFGNLDLFAVLGGIIQSNSVHRFLDTIQADGAPVAINVTSGDTILKDVNANNIVCQSVSGVNLQVFSVASNLTLNAQGGSTTVSGDTGVAINANPGYRATYNNDLIPRVRYVNTLGYNYVSLGTVLQPALPPGRFTAPFAFAANELILYSGFELEFQGAYTPNNILGGAFNVELWFGPTGTETLIGLVSPTFGPGTATTGYVVKIRGHLISATNITVSGNLIIGNSGALIGAVTFSPAFDPTLVNLFTAVYRSTTAGGSATTDWARLTIIQ